MEQVSICMYVLAFFMSFYVSYVRFRRWGELRTFCVIYNFIFHCFKYGKHFALLQYEKYFLNQV